MSSPDQAMGGMLSRTWTKVQVDAALPAASRTSNRTRNSPERSYVYSTDGPERFVTSSSSTNVHSYPTTPLLSLASAVNTVELPGRMVSLCNILTHGGVLSSRATRGYRSVKPSSPPISYGTLHIVPLLVADGYRSK